MKLAASFDFFFLMGFVGVLEFVNRNDRIGIFED